MMTKGIRSGDFRHLVVLQMPDPNAAADEYGHKQPGTFLDVATVYARIEGLTQRERLLAQQVNSEQTHTVTIMYDASLVGMDAKWRVKFGNRYLVFSGDPSNVEERNIVFEIPCQEGLTNV